MIDKIIAGVFLWTMLSAIIMFIGRMTDRKTLGGIGIVMILVPIMMGCLAFILLGIGWAITTLLN